MRGLAEPPRGTRAAVGVYEAPTFAEGPDVRQESSLVSSTKAEKSKPRGTILPCMAYML